MKITHLQSSTQIINLDGIKILTDPWLTDGEYYGSWYHYPPFGESNIAELSYDFIYVSHIHPDHLSESTFKKLPYKKPVLIHSFESKFLKRRLEMFGFQVIECDHGIPFKLPNGGCVTIYAADNCDPELCGKFFGCGKLEIKFGSTQIDTLAVFESNGETIINTNDCPFELAEKTIKINKLDKKNVDVLLVGYGGAGPYPQCFEFDKIEDKFEAAKSKEIQFLEQALRYISLLKPKIFIPFAGTYVLGSTLSKLNEYRGVPSLDDALLFLNEKVSKTSVGLLLRKLDVYDVASNSLKKNVEKFEKSYDDYLKEISKFDLVYALDDWKDEELGPLMAAACERFKLKAEQIRLDTGTQVIIQSDKVAFSFNLKSDVSEVPVNFEPPEPYVKLKVNHNLLHRLLRGPRFAHWDNADVGSHIQHARSPDKYERGLYFCLASLHA